MTAAEVAYPKRTRLVNNLLMETRRWDGFEFRDDVTSQLAVQTHRRFIKSPVPADTLNFQPRVRYLFLARAGRDVIWSWYRHLLHMETEFHDLLNPIPGREGPPLAAPTGTVYEFLHDWMKARGLHDWSYWDHIQSWWNTRRLPN